MTGAQNEITEPQVSHADVSESIKAIEDPAPETFKEIEHEEQAGTITPPAISGPQIAIPDFVAESVADSVASHIGFDPAVHRSDADGNPILTREGAYAKKRGPRKAGDVSRETTSDVPRETASAGIPTQAAAASISTAQTAVFLVTTVTGVLSRAIGPEWAADKQEIKGLSDAVKTYIDSKGGIAITPEMGLVLAIGAYSLPRLAVENTQTKLQMATGWLRDRFDVLRARFNRGG